MFPFYIVKEIKMKSNKPKYQQIIEAAVKVIAENGYHASQVSKIAKEAGVADGTIYLYFKNKEDILVSVFQEKMGQFIERIATVTAKEPNANNKLKALIYTHFALLEESPNLAIVSQLELRQSNHSLRMQINHVLKAYLDVIDDVIEEGINEQEFRHDLKPELLRQMIFGSMDEVVTNWVMQERKYKLTDQAEAVHHFLTEGLKFTNK
jgi:TetR/AcrR family fatty acid metabolism transcriptional regulator